MWRGWLITRLYKNKNSRNINCISRNIKCTDNIGSLVQRLCEWGQKTIILQTALTLLYIHWGPHFRTLSITNICITYYIHYLSHMRTEFHILLQHIVFNTYRLSQECFICMFFTSWFCFSLRLYRFERGF